MRLRVNPNRMELLRLRRRYGLALRGHKMLKDKLEGLIKEFVPMVRRYREARLSVDRELPELLKPFVMARMASAKGTVETALEQTALSQKVAGLKFVTKYWRILNVVLPHFVVVVPQEKHASSPSYSLLDTPAELDKAIVNLENYMDKLLTLIELEHSVRLLAKEIEETRRRVNALEYILLPELGEAIKFIKAKLDEAERLHISRLMKIKEMLAR